MREDAKLTGSLIAAVLYLISLIVLIWGTFKLYELSKQAPAASLSQTSEQGPGR
ncbi:MAG: hypothetical protein K0S45_2188 [Nitrospira sp.]|jgi:hypothetical protein|nr:hypothetical protein [Nitrospira sp.]